MRREAPLGALSAAIRSGIAEHPHGPAGREQAVPFITLSRQAGAGAESFVETLRERLNSLDRSARPWTMWDRELVQKVSEEHQVPCEIIEALDTDHARGSWFADFLSGLSLQAGGLDDFQVLRRVVKTVRALALMGRCILVGRGAVYATEDLPAGVHVRVVAPLEHRIENIARQRNLSHDQAATELNRVERQRETFHRRWWGDRALLPELFTLTLNSAKIDEHHMVDCIVPLVLTVRRSKGSTG